jgi:hypothetical protein
MGWERAGIGTKDQRVRRNRFCFSAVACSKWRSSRAVGADGRLPIANRSRVIGEVFSPS